MKRVVRAVVFFSGILSTMSEASNCCYVRPRVRYYTDPSRFNRTCSADVPVRLSDVALSADRQTIGYRLLALIKQSDPRPFQKLLQQVADQYRNDYQAFFRIIDTRGDAGYNILLRSAVIGDLENLSAIFDALAKVYGTNQEWLFKYLDTRDKSGVGVLSLSSYTGDRKTVELVLIRIIALLGSNRELFFKLLTASETEHGWKPLIDMSDEAQSYSLRMTVKLAKFGLGRDSALFERFINAQDEEGYSAYNSAQTDNDRFFLLHYGALETEPEENDPLINKADELGKKIRKASDQNNFQLFKKAIYQAVDALKDDPHIFFHFLVSRDDGGWNSFMHASAEGQIEFIRLIFQVMEEYIPPSHSDLLYLLLSTADYEGQTPLHLAILRRHYDIALFIIDKLIKYTEDKTEIFYIFNAHDELSGFTPLFNAVYGVYEFDGRAYGFIKQMVEKVANFFGRDSRMFWLWLNARDYNKETSLAYASDDRIRRLLKSYGAIDVPMKKIKGLGIFERLNLYNEL